LFHGVQNGFGIPLDPNEVVGNGLGPGPLFEFHEHIARPSAPRVNAAQHNVNPFGTMRQFVFEKHFHVPEPGIHHIAEERGQAVLP
jgi:hypothetical protein